MIDPNSLLSGVPSGLRAELLACYHRIVVNYQNRHFESAELNGGKLCEIVFTIIQGQLTGSFAARALKPKNLVAGITGMKAFFEHCPSLCRFDVVLRCKISHNIFHGT